ncbi:MAG: ATP-dependent helicase, partial [Actinobacteria bacterium]|nr:ATP-dependent helicase [Actinomycetota bacterium]
MPSKKLSFEELDDAQQAIVNTLNGPVVIYAGAGSGKTRALTHRIANGVVNNIYDPEKVLALSFTTRAADEMALRLSAMGIRNVATRTFHSAALRQLKYFWPDAVGGQMPVIVENKFKVINLAIPESKNRSKEFISVIENAKTNRLNPEDLNNPDYAHAYQKYIEYLDKNNLIDFEDVLMLLVAILEDRPDLLAEVHRAYEWFSVDEYQDVNPLQQALLDLWLGENDNICVVGDVCQTIYSFAGAKNKYLQEFTNKFPEASVFRLNRNYRSSSEIVEFANNLLVQMPSQNSNVGQLFATRNSGEKVTVSSYLSENEEAQFIVEEIIKLIENNVNLKE